MAYPPTSRRIGHLQHDGAGPAASLTAPQLGALEAMLGADEVEEGPVWVRVAQLDAGAIEVEVERGARVGRSDELLEGVSIPVGLGGGDGDLWVGIDRNRKDHLFLLSCAVSFLILPAPEDEGPWQMVVI